MTEEGSAEEKPQEADRTPEAEVVTDENILSPAAEKPAEPDPDNEEGRERDSSDSAPDEPPKKRRSRDRQVKRLKRRTAELEKELAQQAMDREALAAELEELRGRSAEAPKPERGDFDSDEDWAESLVQWKASRTKAPGRKPSPKPERPAPRAATITTEEIDAFRERGRREGGKAFADALERAGANAFRLSETMLRYVMDHSSQPFDTVVHLSKNPELAEEIADEDPVGTAVMMAELESELKPRDSRGRFVSEASKAPPPTPEPEKGRPTPGRSRAADREVATPDEVELYAQKRREQLKKLRGARAR